MKKNDILTLNLIGFRKLMNEKFKSLLIQNFKLKEISFIYNLLIINDNG